jgi:chromosomal replication initiation ATPase DnaA
MAALAANLLILVYLQVYTAFIFTMTTTTIFNAVHAVFGVTPKELTGKRRPKPVTDARMCAAYMLSTEANMELTAIGKAFNKGRPWASFAVLKCQEFGETDKRYAEKVSAVYGKLKAAA